MSLNLSAILPPNTSSSVGREELDMLFNGPIFLQQELSNTFHYIIIQQIDRRHQIHAIWFSRTPDIQRAYLKLKTVFDFVGSKTIIITLLDTHSV
jgi:hypothetical protein